MEIHVNKVAAEDNDIQLIAKADYEKLAKKEQLADAKQLIESANIDKKLADLNQQIAQPPNQLNESADKSAHSTDQKSADSQSAEIDTIGALEIPEVLYFEVLQGLGYDPKYVDRDSADIEKYTAEVMRKHGWDKVTTSPEAAMAAAWLKPAGRTILERLKRSKFVQKFQGKIKEAMNKLSSKSAQEDKPSYPRPDLQQQGGNNGTGNQQ